MIQPPSEYERVQQEAEETLGKTLFPVLCRDHATVVGIVRESAHGEVLCAEIPLEASSGSPASVARLKEMAGARVPPIVYLVRFLVREVGANDPPRGWCRICGSRAIDVEQLRLATDQFRRGDTREMLA